MRTKKLISCLLATSMLAVSAVSAFAAAPADYDGKAYESLGYTSEDPDGEFNLAVIANGDVNIYGQNTMYIRGSVYSNGTIYAANGGGNVIDGLFISGTGDTVFGSDNNDDEWTQYRTAEGYVHVNADGTTDNINYWSVTPQYEGAILDENTAPHGVTYDAYEFPSISNFVDSMEANEWSTVKTISEDTAIGSLNLQGRGLIIDTTAGDVTVVINNLSLRDAYIQTTGGNKANIYVKNSPDFNNFNLTILPQGMGNLWEVTDAFAQAYDYQNNPTWMNDPTTTYFANCGDSDSVNLYLGETGSTVVVNGSHITGNIYSNADSLTIGSAAKIKGNVTTGASAFAITDGGTYVYGTAYAVNADSIVDKSGILIGQLYTDTLKSNGTGQIIYKADKAVTKTEVVPTPEPTAEPTPEPTEEPTPEPVPTGKPIDLTGTGYAYIFGYEPDHIELVWVDDEEGGHTEWDVQIRMAPNDAVTREQVATMIMRMIDQKYDNKNVEYSIPENMASISAGEWYTRGLAYVASKGGFDGVENVELGPITRGEVAKLVAYGLNLSETTETTFEDIADSPYKQYIEIMNAYGYMQGLDDTTFEPDRIMTRAEFCSMFNQIIGREDALLEAADGTEVTPATYYFTDLRGDEWYTPVMLRATSAYDANGYVDIDTRLANIRNTLDHYDSQKLF